jgi:hypothetical protein
MILGWSSSPSWSKGRTAGHIFGREPSNDYFIKILFLLSKRFQTRRFLREFPIGSYVKLSSFYIGPIGSFYNQVNDTGSWEPLVSSPGL